MPYQVKQSTTAYPLVFLMIDSTDHISAKTGLSPTVTLSKAGGSFASPSGAVSEIANGWYKVAGNATDTGTLGPLILHASATGADATDMIFEVVAFDPQDTVRLGLTALPNVASGSAGAIPTTGTGSNQISVSSGQVILQAGTGTGQLDFTSGVVKANATQWLGGTIPAVNVTGVPLVDLKYTLGTISPATAGSVRADAVTGAVGSVTGAVGSVTGAVGSVTGNVGGSVASVTAVSTGAITSGSFAAAAIDAAAIAANAITSSEFAQSAADEVWSSATRTLTANNVSVKKNSALAGFQFVMADSADHVTPKTGLTITAVRSINGAAFAACTNAATEIANGWYTIDLSAADLNGNTIALKFTSTGADQTNILLVTNV